MKKEILVYRLCKEVRNENTHVYVKSVKGFTSIFNIWTHTGIFSSPPPYFRDLGTKFRKSSI